MAGLFDRLSRTGEGPGGLWAHLICSGFSLYVSDLGPTGSDDVTPQKIINAINEHVLMKDPTEELYKQLTAEDIVDLTAMKNNIDAITNANPDIQYGRRMAYVEKIRSTLDFLQSGATFPEATWRVWLNIVIV